MKERVSADGGASTEPAVQSVDRTLHLLELLAASPTSVGLAELARSTGLPQPTVHRLLRTLSNRGWVRQDADRRYVIGAALIGLGNSAERLLAAGARPYLQEAVDVSGETANLAVLETDHVVYVAQQASPHRLRLFTEVGNRAPVHSTGVGKAILAHLPAPTARAILTRTGLPGRTPTTITDPVAFEADLAAIRRRGYATDNGEEEIGVRCLAFPVLDASDHVIGAFSVSGPAARLESVDVDALADRLAPIVRRFRDHLVHGTQS